MLSISRRSLITARVGRGFSVKIADGVEFDTIAREWRLKWSADNDKKSLASAQQGKEDLISLYTEKLGYLVHFDP